MAKTRKGLMPCEGQRCESHDHNAPVVVFENERETLSYSCDFCGRAPYARKGTGQHAEWLEEMARRAPVPATAPAAQVPPPAAKQGEPKAPGQTGDKPAKTGAGTFFG
ncbi:MAG TPA: hypothetical protein VEC35_23380 [Noviherbaspirillum sp.]|nr:hypothetical protein [Noviherbaspirillum sp.]